MSDMAEEAERRALEQECRMAPEPEQYQDSNQTGPNSFRYTPPHYPVGAPPEPAVAALGWRNYMPDEPWIELVASSLVPPPAPDAGWKRWQSIRILAALEASGFEIAPRAERAGDGQVVVPRWIADEALFVMKRDHPVHYSHVVDALTAALVATGTAPSNDV